MAAYKLAAKEGGHWYAPSDGKCPYCKADLAAKFAQGYTRMTGCSSCHRSFVE